MSYPRSTPTAEVRSNLLTDMVKRRVEKLAKLMGEPRPPWTVKKPLEAQVRTYLEQRDNGELAGLRERNGGDHTDEQVDEYVARMERALAKLAPQLVLEPHRVPAVGDATPMGLHPGLLVALGRPDLADPGIAAMDQAAEQAQQQTEG